MIDNFIDHCIQYTLATPRLLLLFVSAIVVVALSDYEHDVSAVEFAMYII